MRILFFLIAMASIHALWGQDLHVFYNAHADSLYYVQDGKPVSKPLIRKGNFVILHIDNFNNYLYNVTVKTQQNRQSLVSGKGLDAGSSFQSGEMNPLNLIFGAISNPGGFNMPGLSFGNNHSGFVSDAKADQEREALVKEMQMLESGFRKTQELIKVIDEDLADIQQQIQAKVESQEIQVVAADAINRIKYNPKLEPQQIKKLTLDYMAHVFGDADPKELSLRELFQKTHNSESITQLEQQYQSNVSLYAAKVEALKLSTLAFQDPRFDIDNRDWSQFEVSANNYVAGVEKNLQTYRSNASMLETTLPNAKNLDMNTLMQLQADYLALGKDFSLVSRYEVEDDKLALEIVFTPVDSINISGVATRRVAPIELQTYGGLQIKGGIGLSFSGFFERPSEYFIRDSTIYNSEKDAFIPVLTSFAHFYSQGRGAISFGGSFGVGVPIGGGGGFESLSFFLGPSLVIGRNQGMAISAGLMGGKVEQLSGGYAVGDFFEASPDLLQTKPVYKLGYFLAFSFNLIGGR